MAYDSDTEFFNAAREAAIYNKDNSSAVKKVLTGAMFMLLGAGSVFGFNYFAKNETFGNNHTIVMGVSHVDANATEEQESRE